ncbi:MAG: 3-dehydroquinate synthase [Parachlamydiaceae bacterium]|nr:3-dehydroquinate synthase [Parachlamydiaceae bacterium]
MLSSQNTFKTPTVIQSDSLKLLKTSLEQLKSSYTQCVIISTPTVFQLFGNTIKKQIENIPSSEILIQPGEEAKTLSTATLCWEQMAERRVDRHSLLIALGGGVITDLTGFVAGCYMRGIDYISIPTTLMAMVDASIGGKTAVNFPNHKNLIGLFNFPKFILIDPKCLHSLSQREFSAGLAEVIKYGVIDRPNLFELLEHNAEAILEKKPVLLDEIIKQCCEIKNDIVQKDAFDKSVRATFNYGHTFGHAIETLTSYQQYTHGETVAIGMSCAAYVSHELNKIDFTFIERQDNLCRKLGLPTKLPSMPIEQIIEKMHSDKKNRGDQITLILPEKIGKVIVAPNFSPNVIHRALLNKQKHDSITN